MVLALYAVGEAERHVVAQIVEAELVVGAIGDVGLVGPAAISRVHLRQDGADIHAEEVVDTPHPLRVTFGQIVVDRTANAPPGQRVEIRRHGRNQRLALAGLHLSDVAKVERGAAHHLDIEVPLVEDLGGLLAYGREGLRQRLERLAFSKRARKSPV